MLPDKATFKNRWRQVLAETKGPGKDSLKSKRLIAGWDKNYLAKIFQPQDTPAPTQVTSRPVQSVFEEITSLNAAPMV